MNCCEYYNITTIAWGCGGFIALLSSREEGGAVADLLIVRRRQQGQWIFPTTWVLAGDRRLRVRQIFKRVV